MSAISSTQIRRLPPWNQVDVLIVDPSCSGSGLPEHHLIDATAETGTSRRVQRLAAFQKRILSHALSFPKAKSLGGVLMFR